MPVPLGLLTRSTNGSYLSLVGPNVAAGTGYSAVSAVWTFAAVSFRGTFNVATQVTG